AGRGVHPPRCSSSVSKLTALADHERDAGLLRTSRRVAHNALPHSRSARACRDSPSSSPARLPGTPSHGSVREYQPYFVGASADRLLALLPPETASALMTFVRYRAGRR